MSYMSNIGDKTTTEAAATQEQKIAIIIDTNVLIKQIPLR